MDNTSDRNVSLFSGFAQLYDDARPRVPALPAEIIRSYLGRTPGLVVDLGCGTGLSTMVWQGRCGSIIGIDASEDMLRVARSKGLDGVSFRHASAYQTGLDGGSADVVVCSQSFHWMEPKSALAEIGRILTSGGVFAAIDYEWPPVCGKDAELAYRALMETVQTGCDAHPAAREKVFQYDKNSHLSTMEQSGCFSYTREIVFMNTEPCNATRMIALAFSQGRLQELLKSAPDTVSGPMKRYEEKILSLFRADEFDIGFCYRMRIGVK